MAAEASVYASADLTVTVDTVTLLDFNAEMFDVGAMHDPVTNPSRLTVPAAENGYYLVTAQVAWANAGGTKGYWAFLRHNGTIVARDSIENISGSGIVFNGLVAVLALGVGDYVDVQVLQSGGTINDWIRVGGASYTFLQAIRVA